MYVYPEYNGWRCVRDLFGGDDHIDSNRVAMALLRGMPELLTVSSVWTTLRTLRDCLSLLVRPSISRYLHWADRLMDPQDLKADAMRLGAQAALMRELLHTPMWACFLEYAEQMVEDSRERAILKTAGEFEKGVIAGMRDLLRIPENLIAWAERANRN